ncbi:DNA adenine methylase [Umezakia ovalisporum]|jgi:DNA adenine methylase|uniref:site-specific DNA-methyltransferase (adenine-specific) n=1 Tax=Umezakia ovalisporum FSS-43 TaxID=2740520 RepID=A0ABT6JZH3_9CYAN|nr:DNA adenine methylase [Umezakia ovalisporum]MDH6055417.1 DNA adenine methylase [Umezakia ovalisporum FSS-43]
MGHYRTPLRYPGGKQRLTPFIFELLQSNDLLGCDYSEPYAGGSGVALELLLNFHVNHIHLNDSSFPIYAFWNSVLNNPEQLCRMIFNASLNIEEWKFRREVVRNPLQYSELEVGFSTFFLNRCNRSGVITGGVIGGLNQTGKWKIDARFSRNELIRRIEIIADRRNDITVTNLDAEEYIINNVSNLPERTFVYCDPPYFEKSSRLYLNSYCKSDHFQISQIIQNKLNKPWIVSYDSAYEILDYYSNRRSFIYDLQYNASRVYKGQEVFIFSDLLTLPSFSKLSYINDALQACLMASS